MKAVNYNKMGSANEVLEFVELDTPSPAHGEVLVKLKFSAVHPSDVKKRAGGFPDLLDDGFIIPHSDGAGVIEAVGHGVPHSRIGERVWVYQAQYGRRFGTAAEYVAVDTNRAVFLPDNTGFDIGACMGIPAMTAHRCVFADGPVEGQTILVTGGAGRVGHYVIQWAKYAGASVIATASNPEAEAECYAAGADIICPHQGDKLLNTVAEMTDGQGVERIVDGEFGGNLPVLLDVARTGATIATYASMAVPEPTIPFRRMMFMDLTIRMVLVYAMPESAKLDAIDDITNFLERDLLQHRIAYRVPLNRTVDAHELIEKAGFYGMVLIDTE
jgi:NADPH2:quinone reductase